MIPPSPGALELARGPSPDEAIIERVLDGETALFEVLMRRHNTRVYRAVRGLVDEVEAEDVMQQAWLRAYSHLASFRREARFATWLTRIAVHEALARSRRARRLVPLEDEEEEAISMDAPPRSPEVDAGRRELIEWIEAEAGRLPEIYRSVFLLREVEGLDTAETADALGIGEDAVKQRLHRARERVRAGLAQRIGAAAPAAFPFEAPRCDRLVEAVMAALPSRAV